MRIIGGQWKGRRINIPSKNWPVRPTTDFAREALFNILDNRLDYEVSSALDLFGGTGIHSFELASRGCRDITYVDKFRESVKVIQRIADEWHAPVKTIQADAHTYIAKADRKWDYVFADPPYDHKNLDELIDGVQRVLNENGFFVLEHSSNHKFDAKEGFMEARQYGQTVFTFFKAGS